MASVAILSVLLMVVGCVLAYPTVDSDQDYLQYLAELAAERSKAQAVQSLEQQMRSRGGDDTGAQLAEEESVVFNGGLVEVPGWLAQDVNIGQVGGVAVCPGGYPHVFHRADRQWGADSFDGNDVFTQQSQGPIKENTVLTLDPETGAVTDAWGAGTFYMPHGLTIDGEGNLWLTDVALHQVFKYSPEKELLLTLGVALEPSLGRADPSRFCKPTHVAVADNGDFFVADGYCNQRVVKFNAKGEYLGQFGDADELMVPHSVALLDKYNAVCVADRENERIVCYNAGLDGDEELGQRLRIYDDPSMGRVYAIAYSVQDDLLYGIGTGEESGNGDAEPHGFTIDVSEEQGYYTDIVSSWVPAQGFMFPHALAVSGDGEAVYVGELFGDETHPSVLKMVKAEQPKEAEEEELEEEDEDEDEDEEEEDEDEDEEEEDNHIEKEAEDKEEDEKDA